MEDKVVSVVVGIGGDDGGSGDSDVDEERMMSEVFVVTAGKVELEAGINGPPGATTVTVDVETCTTVVGVGVLPMPVARKGRPSWSSSSLEGGRNGRACPAPLERATKWSRMSTPRSGCRFSG